MNRVLLVFILSLVFQISFGQACGKYHIQYVGKIEAKTGRVEKVKLPSIMYLHNLKNKESNKNFIEIQPNGNEIVLLTSSHLTSNLFGSSDSLLRFYKSKSDSIPVVLILSINGNLKENVIKLAWEDIELTKGDNEEFGNFFIIDLGVIETN
jgi:hypothetical protein